MEVPTQGVEVISVTATPKSQYSPTPTLQMCFSWKSQRCALIGCLGSHFPFFLDVLCGAFPSLSQLSFFTCLAWVGWCLTEGSIRQVAVSCTVTLVNSAGLTESQTVCSPSALGCTPVPGSDLTPLGG